MKYIVLFLFFLFIAVNLFSPLLERYFFVDSYLLLNSSGEKLFQPFFAHSYYRPVVALIFLLEKRYWGQQVIGYNMVNVLFHALNALGVVLLADKIVKAPFAGAAAGLFFLVHPAGANAVSWLAGLVDLAACFFILATVLVFLYGSSRKWTLIAVPLLMGLSMLTKETGFFLPLILLMILGFRDPVPTKKHVVIWGCIWVLLVSGILVLRWEAFHSWDFLRGHIESSRGIIKEDIYERAASFTAWFSGAMLHRHSLFVLESIKNPEMHLFVLVPASLIFLMHRVTRLGWFWYWLFVLPTFGTLETLRYVYLPSVGISLIVGWAFAVAVPKTPFRGFQSILLIMGLMVPITLMLVSRECIRSYESRRFQASYAARRMADAAVDPPAGANIFVYGLHQPVQYSGGIFYPGLSVHALRFFLNRNDIKVLKDLDEDSDSDRLCIYRFQNGSMIGMPEVAKRLAVWRRIPFRSDKTRIPASDVTVEPGMVSFVVRDGWRLFRYLQIQFRGDRDEMKKRFHARISWSYEGEPWKPEQSISCLTVLNEQGGFCVNVYLGTVFAFRSREVRRVRIDFPSVSSLDILFLEAELADTPANSREISPFKVVQFK